MYFVLVVLGGRWQDQDRRLTAGYRHLGCFRFDAGDGRMTKKLEAIDMTLEVRPLSTGGRTQEMLANVSESHNY